MYSIIGTGPYRGDLYNPPPPPPFPFPGPVSFVENTNETKLLEGFKYDGRGAARQRGGGGRGVKGRRARLN